MAGGISGVLQIDWMIDRVKAVSFAETQANIEDFIVETDNFFFCLDS